MSKEIRITIKPTIWLFSTQEMEPKKYWNQIDGIGHKVEIRMNEHGEPFVIITEHYDENDRRKRVELYRSSEIPMSAADAADLLESVLYRRDLSRR